jgi:NitT/TauT family transport system ATP-binding protein
VRTPIIEVHDVAKQFDRADGPFEVLRGITLSVAAGEIVAVVGASGSGKTTLLNLLSQSLRPTTGTIRFGDSSDQRTTIGRVFQTESVFPWLTVKQNVSFGLTYNDTPSNQFDAIASHYIHRVGLEPFTDWWPRDLSGGMRRRVELARAYAVKPKVLLLDEPFIALDAFTRDEMQRLLLDLWHAERNTVVLTTHDIEEAVFLSHRVIVLSERPAVINGTVSVPFAMPRASSLKLDPDFVAIRAQVLRLLGPSQQLPGTETP